MAVQARVTCCPSDLTLRPDQRVRVVDCTVRDGGLCNDWQFDTDLVRRTLRALGAAGVDVVEIGYRAKRDEGDKTTGGPWRYSSDEDIRAVTAAGGPKLAVMVDQGKAQLSDLGPKADSPIDIVRMATYAKDIDAALDFMEGAGQLGYEVFCNVMAVSQCTPREVDDFLAKLRRSSVPNVAVVDSFGALLPHHVRHLVRTYKAGLRPDQQVGVHMHNNQQTAFANSVVAIEEGANFVDATLFGMGRGSGNCPIELLLMYLEEARFDLRPILAVVDDYAALSDQLRWGYHLPYALSGWLNLHPRAAIEAMKAPRPDSAAFYDRFGRNTL